MPDKVKELERVWQEQTDRYTELARQTLSTQPKIKGGTAREAAKLGE